jgi:trehalose 6-phosphate synthase/phosphatase
MQTWADTFISELNDTHIEADLRLRHTPPELEIGEVRTCVLVCVCV